MYRTDVLCRLLERVVTCEGYKAEAQLNVLLCDDAYIAELNRAYRRKRGPTDVLSFEYESIPGTDVERPLLGDIVISLETVERRCGGACEAMRQEIRLLFCHGVLHLLGQEHDTAAKRRAMAAKQARYLGITPEEAWIVKH
jgi:probable rRNA maturation factor